MGEKVSILPRFIESLADTKTSISESRVSLVLGKMGKKVSILQSFMEWLADTKTSIPLLAMGGTAMIVFSVYFCKNRCWFPFLYGIILCLMACISRVAWKTGAETGKLKYYLLIVST